MSISGFCDCGFSSCTCVRDRRDSCGWSAGYFGCAQFLAGEKQKLEILKDSHAGAFAVITAAVYFVCWYGAYSQLFGIEENMKAIGILSLGFMVSRCLSGIGVITFPKAKADGTVAEFSRNSSDVISRNILVVYLVILAVLMIWIEPVWGIAAFAGALLIFGYYHHIAMKYFGGTTGDISGFSCVSVRLEWL